MTVKAFHDAVLTYTAIPIDMIRAGILALPPKGDYAPSRRLPDEPAP